MVNKKIKELIKDKSPLEFERIIESRDCSANKKETRFRENLFYGLALFGIFAFGFQIGADSVDDYSNLVNYQSKQILILENELLNSTNKNLEIDYWKDEVIKQRIAYEELIMPLSLLMSCGAVTNNFDYENSYSTDYEITRISEIK